jgi:hypothetical protein
MMDALSPDVARMERSEIREDNLTVPLPDSGLRPASGRHAAPPLWTRGELALFHPYLHDNWADEFVTLARDDEVWGFGDMLSTNGQGITTCKAR